MQPSIEKNFLKSSLRLYVFSYLIAPVTFFTKIFLTHQLTPSQVGVLYTIIGSLLILNSLGDFGIGQTYLKLIPEKITKKQYDTVLGIFLFGLTLQFIIGIVVWGIMFFGSGYISTFFLGSIEYQSTLQVFSGFFVVYNIYQGFSMLYLAFGNTFVQKGVDFLRMAIILFLVFFISKYIENNVYNISYAWLISVCLGLIFFVIYFYFFVYKKYFITRKAKISRGDIREIFSLSIPFLFAAQSTYILSQIDMLMAQYFLGSYDAGIYSAYLSIIGIPFMLCGPIFSLFLPLFSTYFGQGKIQKIYNYKENVSKIFFLIGLFWTILFFIFSTEISFFLFGQEYIKSGHILKMSIFFLPFIFLHQINFSVYNAVGKIKVRLFIILSTIIVNIVTNFFAIKYLGLAGVALSTGFGWLYIRVLTECFSEKSFDIDRIFVGKNLAISIIIMICMSYIMGYVEFYGRLSIFMGIMFFSVILILLFLSINKGFLNYIYQNYKYQINK